ncbi:MAG TPA: hypothetical protein VHT25_10670 [Solirubrobacteraceae bacterium]|jgi:hypothetical protein|nr:hypothetical protein [Solirubrobacteraceae bacterium]
MGKSPSIDYVRLVAEHAPTSATWDAFVREVIVDRWIAEYQQQCRWQTQVLEIQQGELTFLYDAGPTLIETRHGEGEDRVVATWGRSVSPAAQRDRARLSGFLRDPRIWSEAHRDRGHFVAHSAGGGTDLNLFPQAASLNRGRTPQGRRWREMERYAARHPGTPLFLRPIYDSARWTPAELDFGILKPPELRLERFSNSG